MQVLHFALFQFPEKCESSSKAIKVIVIKFIARWIFTQGHRELTTHNLKNSDNFHAASIKARVGGSVDEALRFVRFSK